MKDSISTEASKLASELGQGPSGEDAVERLVTGMALLKARTTLAKQITTLTGPIGTSELVESHQPQPPLEPGWRCGAATSASSTASFPNTSA
jgi:hypothetical protein